MLTAIIAGAALAASGLLLQTAFRNPLAGPSVLGINSGASLGVAVVILLFGGSVSAGVMSWSGYAAVMAGAFVGSLAVIGVLLALSAVIRSDLMLLIVGVMIGYLASSLIMLLNYTSTADGIQSYVMWGMGNFSGVTSSSLPMFALIAGAGIVLSLLLVKPLNIVQLGADYASSLGVNLGRVRNMLLLATGLLSSSVTSIHQLHTLTSNAPPEPGNDIPHRRSSCAVAGHACSWRGSGSAVQSDMCASGPHGIAA
jgi:iron complex transport system permease protein